MRIISGRHRGRTILSPVGLTTRPIPDRVKLALFNILCQRLEGAVVLDLFSGTGSMGLESISRGARMVYFAERDRTALDLLGRNIQAIGAEADSRVWRGDVLRQLPQWLQEVDGDIDIAFIDPPYELVRTWDWREANRDIFGPIAGRLAADGIVELRCARDTPTPEAVGALRLRQRRDYGGMSLVFFGPTVGAEARANEEGE